MPLFRKLIILALIVGLALIAVKLVLPFAIWVFEVALTVLVLIAIGIAIVYLHQKLRA